MFCENCGSPVPDGAEVCGACGKKLPTPEEIEARTGRAARRDRVAPEAPPEAAPETLPQMACRVLRENAARCPDIRLVAGPDKDGLTVAGKVGYYRLQLRKKDTFDLTGRIDARLVGLFAAFCVLGLILSRVVHEGIDIPFLLVGGGAILLYCWKWKKEADPMVEFLEELLPLTTPVLKPYLIFTIIGFIIVGVGLIAAVTDVVRLIQAALGAGG